MIRVTEIGWKALEAIRRTGGEATIVAPLTRSMYLMAADTLVWAGPSGSAMHGRAIITRDVLPRDTDRLKFDARGISAWRPALIDRSRLPIDDVRIAARRLLDGIGIDDLAPAGFATLLVGGVPDTVLEPGIDDALALARACEADDPALGSDHAVGLVGIGTGLTPSGDDFVGGVFYALALQGRLGAEERTSWDEAADTVAEAARVRSHPISAILLADMLRGEGHAPLHRLAALLSSRDPDMAHAFEAVRELVEVGTSSGWNILAGFLGGVLGPDAFSQGSLHRPGGDRRRPTSAGHGRQPGSAS